MEKLFDLKGLMDLFNANDIKSVVALEKKLVNFLTQEQLEQIAQIEKEELTNLFNAKVSYDALKEKYNIVSSKLESIGINVNSILAPQPQQQEEEEEEEDDYDDYDDYDEDEDEEEDF